MKKNNDNNDSVTLTNNNDNDDKIIIVDFYKKFVKKWKEGDDEFLPYLAESIEKY